MGGWLGGGRSEAGIEMPTGGGGVGLGGRNGEGMGWEGVTWEEAAPTSGGRRRGVERPPSTHCTSVCVSKPSFPLCSGRV